MNTNLQAALKLVRQAKAQESNGSDHDRGHANGHGHGHGHGHGDEVKAPAVDWEAAVGAGTRELLEGLATERGVSMETLMWMREAGLIGWYEGCVAFPLQGAKGAVVGCHVKTAKGWIWRKPEGEPIGPLILGNLENASYVVGCESQWDAIAVADKLGGFDTGAVFVCTRGAGNGAMMGKVKIPEGARVVLMPQNDAVNAAGKIPSEEWFNAAQKSLTNNVVYRAVVPEAFEDANEWVRRGATGRQVADAITLAKNATVAAMRVRSIVDCSEKPIDESATLLGNRYLCREGSMLFIGPSGVGKSSASVQQDISWGLGLEAFGIKPARALKILTIQAENDDGDMTEMARGVIDGLGLNGEQREMLRRQVIYATVKTKTGQDFIHQVLAPLLDCYRPDIVRIDPFQSYLGDDFKEARALLEFCQTGLNPLLEKYQCGCILNHHTPKTSNRDTEKWKATDWMYAGAGSAHLTNWARAVMVVDATRVAGLFKFIAAKRGGRLGWDEGVERYFAHSREVGKIVWEEPDVADILEAEDTRGESNRKGGSGGGGTSAAAAVNQAVAADEAEVRRQDVLKLLQNWPLTTAGWEKKAKTELNVSRTTFFRLHKELVGRALIEQVGKNWKVTEAGMAALGVVGEVLKI